MSAALLEQLQQGVNVIGIGAMLAPAEFDLFIGRPTLEVEVPNGAALFAGPIGE